MYVWRGAAELVSRAFVSTRRHMTSWLPALSAAQCSLSGPSASYESIRWCLVTTLHFTPFSQHASSSVHRSCLLCSSVWFLRCRKNGDVFVFHQLQHETSLHIHQKTDMKTQQVDSCRTASVSQFVLFFMLNILFPRNFEANLWWS